MPILFEIAGGLRCKLQLPDLLRWILRILILLGIGGAAWLRGLNGL